MAVILSVPFRLLGNGSVATVDQDSDEANAEQIGVLATTLLGERPLAPGFGVSDPTFADLDTSEVLAGIAQWGPPVTVLNINAAWESDSTQLITVEFE